MSVGKIIQGVLGAALIAVGVLVPGAQFLIAAGVSLVAGAVLGAAFGPATPKIPRTKPSDRLYATLDPSAPRKWVFGGPTAMATDVRYQTYTGTDQDTYWQVICVASHEVQSIDEIWLDNEKAWSASGGILGRYVGYMTVTTRTLGTSANGIAIDSTWTASCTLTGCAYVVISYKLTGASDSEDSPFASGVTNRVTIRGNGAKVYDPRLDTTVTGGSGSQRAATQSTWAWDANASRNQALQLLWFMLGWDINSKLALGMGLPPARLDLPSFITAANACDESVTLNGGGTEPRYRCDGVMSEGDDRQAVIESLCSMMNATLRDAGGKLALTVLHNDLSTPVGPFTEGDILDGGKWTQTPPISQSFNIVRGRRIDPSDTALYQPVDFPEVSLTSPDGIDRIDTQEYQFVQSNGQAQRLAKQRLERNQYQGRYSFTGGERWWQTSVGDPVQLSHQTYGWSNKLFRVVEQKISRTGATSITLLEENAAIYQWDNLEAPPVTPGAPTIYDPTNSPILTGIRERKVTTGNMLTDTLFSRKWTLSAGVVRAKANALLGYALGTEPYYCELSPSTTLVRSALSEKVRINPGQKYYFGIRAQRGTTLGTGSRLNLGGQWLGSDGVTVVGTFTEGTQQTPTGLTAGALPKEANWSGTAPATAYYVQLNFYTPALASSSGTFRIARPWVSITDPGGTPSIGYGPTSYAADYAADGTALSGELPFDLVWQMYLGGVAQTAGITWTYKLISGGINSKIPSSGAQAMTGSGAGTLTVNTLEFDSSTVLITGTAANGSTATTTVVIAKAYATATGVSGGGGSSGDSPAQTSGFTAINSTTFTVISNTLTYTVPTGQTTITNTVNLFFKPTKTGGTGSWTVEMKVQRNISGTWTDQGATFSGATDVETDAETGQLLAVGVTLSGTRQSTGLTAGTQYSERIVARLTSGTRSHTATGSVSMAAP